MEPGSDELALRSWGLRFSVDSVEQDYRRWRVVEGLTFTRLGMVAGIVAWSGIPVAFYFGMPEAFPIVVAWIVLLVIPMQLGAIAVSYSGASRRWMMPVTAVVNSVSGFLTVWMSMGLVGSPGVTAGAVTLVVYFGFTIYRMSPALATLAVTPYVAVALYWIRVSFLDGVVGRAEFAGFMLVPLTAMATGAVICGALEKVNRETYRSERRLKSAHDLIRRYVPTEIAEAALAGTSQPIGKYERRKLTIFFSDLVGFTDMSEDSEPEDLAQLLNDYFAEMTRIAEKHGGTVDRLVGDAIMILFGIFKVTDDRDHALRAVRMATEMQEAVTHLNQRWHDAGIPQSVRVRMGINTGLVTVGNFGSPKRMKYTAHGRHANLAARLQSHAEPGRIVISQATWLLVQAQIPCTARGEVSFKGVHKPVAVYEVAATTRMAEDKEETWA